MESDTSVEICSDAFCKRVPAGFVCIVQVHMSMLYDADSTGGSDVLRNTAMCQQRQRRRRNMNLNNVGLKIKKKKLPLQMFNEDGNVGYSSVQSTAHEKS